MKKEKQKTFKEDYDAVIEEIQRTNSGVKVTLDIKMAKKQSIELEQRGKHALFRSILAPRKMAMVEDFIEENIELA